MVTINYQHTLWDKNLPVGMRSLEVSCFKDSLLAAGFRWSTSSEHPGRVAIHKMTDVLSPSTEIGSLEDNVCTSYCSKSLNDFLARYNN